jgi:O-antigen ligase
MEISNFNFYKNKIAPLFLYGFLFGLSIILINPWGGDRGEIWTAPKLIVIQLIVILNLGIILRHVRKSPLVISTAWKLGLSLWILFLGVGTISTCLSPFPLRSFWGQSSLGDGLLYWFFVAAFVVSNALVLYLKPKLVRYQLYGLLAGGVILAIGIFLQVIDWRIDFTATSGQVNNFYLGYDILKSSIYRGEMPIGFYTNRGEAAFPLTMTGVLTLLGLLWGWLSVPIAGLVYLLVSTFLFYTRCRGALLALLVALICLLVRFRSDSTKRNMIIYYGVGLLLVGYLIFKTSATFLTPESIPQALPNNLRLRDFTSLQIRANAWQLSLKAITQRPFFGWGFDGFGIVHPYLTDWMGKYQNRLVDKVDVAKIIRVYDYDFDYLGVDGIVHVGYLITNKAHNLILDIAISVGILGLVSYLSLFIFFIWCAVNSTFRGIEATAIAYLVYTLTWYESGQFSHLGWWGLSVGLGCTKLFQDKKKHS